MLKFSGGGCNNSSSLLGQNLYGKELLRYGFAVSTLLAIACQSSPQEESIEQSELAVTQLAPKQVALFQLSSAVPLSETAMLATKELVLSDNSRVTGGTLVAGQRFEAKYQSHAENVISGGDVILRNNAQITGLLKSPRQAELSAGANVNAYTALADPGFVEVPLLHPLPISNASLNLERDQEATLNPGDHGNVMVKSAARLILSPGVHRFRSLIVSPQAIIELTTADQPVILLVEGTLQLRGALEGEPKDVAVIGLSPNQIPVDAAFGGTIIAKDAEIKLEDASASKQYTGSLFGKNIDLSSPLELIFSTFAHWGALVPPQPLAKCFAYSRGNKLAGFSYTNYLDEALLLNHGEKNHFEKAPDAFRGNSIFTPGPHELTTLVPVGGETPEWHLGGFIARFDGSEPGCTAAQLNAMRVKVAPSDANAADLGIVDPIELPRANVPARAAYQPPRPAPIWAGDIPLSERQIVYGDYPSKDDSPSYYPSSLALGKSGNSPGAFSIQSTSSSASDVGYDFAIDFDLTKIRYTRDNAHYFDIFAYAGVGGCETENITATNLSTWSTEGDPPALLENCGPAVSNFSQYHTSQKWRQVEYWSEKGAGTFARSEDGTPDPSWLPIPETELARTRSNEYYRVYFRRNGENKIKVAMLLEARSHCCVLGAAGSTTHSYFRIAGEVSLLDGSFTPLGKLTATRIPTKANEYRVDDLDSDFGEFFAGPANIRVRVIDLSAPSYPPQSTVKLCPELGGDYADLADDMPMITTENDIKVRWGRFPGKTIKLRARPAFGSDPISVPPVFTPGIPASEQTVTMTLGADGCVDIPAGALVGITRRDDTTIGQQYGADLSIELDAEAPNDLTVSGAPQWKYQYLFNPRSSAKKTFFFSAADVDPSSPGLGQDRNGFTDIIPGAEIVLRSAERSPVIRTMLAVHEAGKHLPPSVTDLGNAVRTLNISVNTPCTAGFDNSSCLIRNGGNAQDLGELRISGPRSPVGVAGSKSCTAETASQCGAGEGCYEDADYNLPCPDAPNAACFCAVLDGSFWLGIVSHEAGHAIDRNNQAEAGSAWRNYFNCVEDVSQVPLPGALPEVCSCTIETDSGCVQHPVNENQTAYYDLTSLLDTDCSCRGVEGSAASHCMSSLEPSQSAKAEGFAHAIASLVQYPVEFDTECKMQYYKSVPAQMLDSNSTSSNWVPAPSLVRCATPEDVTDGIRWRNNQCAEAKPDQRFSTEADWLGFYRYVISHPAGPQIGFDGSQLIESEMCAVADPIIGCPRSSFGWLDDAAKNTLGWLSAAERFFGPTSTKITDLKNAGRSFGIDESLSKDGSSP